MLSLDLRAYNPNSGKSSSTLILTIFLEITTNQSLKVHTYNLRIKYRC